MNRTDTANNPIQGRTIAKFMSIAAILVILVFAAPAKADTTWTLDSGGSCNIGAGAGALDCVGTDGTDGNERVFTSGSETVRARAFSSQTNTGGGNFILAFLGQYSGGLGVTNSLESGTSPNHGTDNAGRDEAVVFMFDNANYIATGLYLGWVSGDSDLDVWIGGNTKTWADFTSMSIATLSANGFTKYSASCADLDTASSSARSVNLNKNCPATPANLSGKFLVVAARNEFNGSTDEGEDYFKIKTVTAKPTTTPEPTTLLLLGLGLTGLALATRKTR
jgi:hypothetical protein